MLDVTDPPALLLPRADAPPPMPTAVVIVLCPRGLQGGNIVKRAVLSVSEATRSPDGTLVEHEAPIREDADSRSS